MMGGTTPKTILTDQNRAMEVANNKFYPDTVHHWRKWEMACPEEGKGKPGAIVYEEE